MPDFTLTNAFIKTYSDNIRLLTQQMVNQFRDKVIIHNIVGQKYYVDYVGTSKPKKRAGSTAPTAHSTMAHSRRRIMSDTFDDSKLVDRNDIMRMGTDPTNPYMQAMKAGYERLMDEILMTAALGTAISVSGSADGSNDESETNVTFPSTQIVSESGTIGGTAQKLKDTLLKFNVNDVPQDEKKFLAFSPYFLNDLLSEPDMSLADREALNIIRTGSIKEAFGFTCLMTNRLPAAVANIRSAVAWTRAGLTLGITEEVLSRVTEESQFHFAIQLWMSMDLGATRMEEKLVVAVQSYENP